MSEADQIIPGLLSADVAAYPDAVTAVQSRYLDFPRLVSIETQVRCNAKCGFCPYPLSERKGQELETATFEKIIDDLTDIPSTHKFNITLCRINEPLLDDRLEEFHRIIKSRLPNAYPQFWSNGTTLRPGRFEWMSRFPGTQLAISLNSVDEEEHTSMMGFGLKAVLPNLDYLHKLVVSKQFPLKIALRAPYENPQQAAHFVQYCSARWPKFSVGLRPYFTWEGEHDTGRAEQERTKGYLPARNLSLGMACGQWYDLHILADGYATKCCIDEAGFNGQEAFDCRTRHVLDVYRESRPLRETLPARETVSGCETCVHLG